MIQDTDEDILNSDFLKWATSIKQSFRYQLKDNIRKRIVSVQTAVNTPSTLFPFNTNLYVQYRTSLSGLFIPLNIPLEVFVVSYDVDDIEYCINSAFNMLFDKMRSGFELLGHPQDTLDYRYFFPIASTSTKSLDSNFDLKNRFYSDILYSTKNMKSNLFEDTYEILQRGSLL